MFWEELSSDDFPAAVKSAEGTCLLPFGVIEKHGSHLPLGTDMLQARAAAAEIAKVEPVVIFPYYCFGQIAEARHVPGTISISHDVMYMLLEETCDEISRNGLKKIIILNNHGGNVSFIYYFIQSTLRKKKDYAVYTINAWINQQEMMKYGDLGHGGKMETAMVMAIRPDLVKKEKARLEEGVCLDRLAAVSATGIYTAINWYAMFPNHFDGDPAEATAEDGENAMKDIVKRLAAAVRAVKDDRIAQELLTEFYSKW